MTSIRIGERCREVDRLTKHRRNKVVADAFDFIEAGVFRLVQLLGQGKNGSFRIDANHLAVGQLLLDFAADTSRRSTGSRRQLLDQLNSVNLHTQS